MNAVITAKDVRTIRTLRMAISFRGSANFLGAFTSSLPPHGQAFDDSCVNLNKRKLANELEMLLFIRAQPAVNGPAEHGADDRSDPEQPQLLNGPTTNE
jgi:hypothetical protein